MWKPLIVATFVLGCSAGAPEPASPGPGGAGDPGGATGDPGATGDNGATGEPGTWTDEPDTWTDEEPAAPAPPAQPAATGAPSADMKAVVDAHNRYRAQHCAPPLTWSAKVAARAQAWANQLRDAGCKFDHSPDRDLGENLAAGSAGALSPQGVVDMWYREVDKYDFGNPRFGMDTGHFTQVVWVGTTQVGCGVSQCNGMTIWVCNYAPPGNMQGGFPANVKPKGC